MIVETKDFQQLPENRGKAWNTFFPKTFRRNMAHLKNRFQTSRHKNYKKERKKNVYYFMFLSMFCIVTVALGHWNRRYGGGG